MAEMYTLIVECVIFCLARYAANESKLNSVVGSAVRLC